MRNCSNAHPTPKQTGMLLLREYRKIMEDMEKHGKPGFLDFPVGLFGPGGIPEASQSLWDPSCMNTSPNGAIWTCFGSIFMIFLPNLVLSNLHNLCICFTETTSLLHEDHTVSVWHYHNSENPYHPSTATCLSKLHRFMPTHPPPPPPGVHPLLST